MIAIGAQTLAVVQFIGVFASPRPFFRLAVDSERIAVHASIGDTVSSPYAALLYIPHVVH